VKAFVVDVVEVVAIGETAGGDIRTLVELNSTPSQAVLPLKSVSDTKRRDFASSATTRGTVSSDAWD
jgi:hypothetical protein